MTNTKQKQTYMKHYMRHTLCILLITICPYLAYSASTTYTFNSMNWGSTVGTIKTDGKTDGWICNLKAYNYSAGYTDAKGLIYGRGVSVKKSNTGAGATSVISFTEVRSVSFNYCQNATSGQGSITVCVGDNDSLQMVISAPVKDEDGRYMKDVEFDFSNKPSGNISFRVECTSNAINISSITIRAKNGSPSNEMLTEATYQLVTDASQLKDSDQIIIGVMDMVNKPNKIMGYYDENISRNNVHAISGKYNDERTVVNANDNAIYTLRKHEGYYTIMDEIRYEQAYLVASGGTPNNYLTLWDSPESPSYGDYGHWSIDIASNGEANITSMGVSLSNMIQYNATHDLFSCYQSASQTPVCIYKKQSSVNIDEPAIRASLLNFGEVTLYAKSASGSKTIEVKSQLLTEDITVKLKHGDVFTLEQNSIDMDGGDLTINYHVYTPGTYVDTLYFASGGTHFESAVMIYVYPALTIDDVVKLEDYEKAYMREVVITKKYDKYVFVRDNTGSMLLYDNHIYAQNRKNGEILSNVTGRYYNYFGVPELQLSAPFTVSGNKECKPEKVRAIDSTDVCRYVQMDSVSFNDEGQIVLGEQILPISDLFNYGGQYSTSLQYNVTGIVYIDHDVVTISPVAIEQVPVRSALEEVDTEGLSKGQAYTILGQPVTESYNGVVIMKGRKLLVR